jgi:hypothetical protein
MCSEVSLAATGGFAAAATEHGVTALFALPAAVQAFVVPMVTATSAATTAATGARDPEHPVHGAVEPSAVVPSPVFTAGPAPAPPAAVTAYPGPTASRTAAEPERATDPVASPPAPAVVPGTGAPARAPSTAEPPDALPITTDTPAVAARAVPAAGRHAGATVREPARRPTEDGPAGWTVGSAGRMRGVEHLSAEFWAGLVRPPVPVPDVVRAVPALLVEFAGGALATYTADGSVLLAGVGPPAVTRAQLRRGAGLLPGGPARAT